MLQSLHCPGRAPELNIQNVIDVFCTASDLGIRPLEKKCWKVSFSLNFHLDKCRNIDSHLVGALFSKERGIVRFIFQ